MNNFKVGDSVIVESWAHNKIWKDADQVDRITATNRIKLKKHNHCYYGQDGQPRNHSESRIRPATAEELKNIAKESYIAQVQNKLREFQICRFETAMQLSEIMEREKHETSNNRQY